MKRWIFLSISFFMIPVILLAQDEYHILDPNSNKSIHYETKYIEKQIDKLNIYEPVFILYPVIKNQNREKVINKINQRIEDIVLKQIITDSFKTKIIEHYKRQLVFALQREHQRIAEEYNDDYYDEEEAKVEKVAKEYYQLPVSSDYYEKTPVVFSLKEVDFEFLSYSDPVLATIVKFVYVVKNPESQEMEFLNFFQPHYFNVFSGKEFLPEQLLKNSSSEILTTLIKDKIYENKNLIKDPEQRIPESKDKYSFQLGKGSYFWFDLNSFNGHLINSLNGDEFTLSFSPDEIKPFLNPVGPYVHLISFKTPVNTLYKNLNYPDYQEKRARRFFNPFPVIDGIPENYKSKKLKEIQINIVKNTSDKSIEGKEVISKKYLFNEKGLVNEIEIYDDGHSHGKMIFSYNERNLISKKVYLSYGEVQTEITYEYDKNNNLTREKSIYNGNEFNETMYTYGNNYFDKGNTSFKERYYLDSTGNVIKFLSRYSDANYYYQTNYRYDASFRLIASYSYNQSPLQGYLYAYNKNGKLLSLEYDNQRYRSEYAYDTLGNCIEEVKYDGIQGGSRIRVEYNSDNMPSKYSEGDKMFVIHYYYR